MNAYQKITRDGLWKNNPGLVQLLGLCPLLAVTNSVVNALGLGLATLAVLVSSNLIVSLTRHLIPKTIRIAIFVLLISALVSSVELLMNAYAHDLYRALGIFLPLIVTNCVIIGRAESFASRQPPLLALTDGLMMSLGFGVVLVCLGAMREIAGYGTLLRNAQTLFGNSATDWSITVLTLNHNFLLAILPPGAFFAMALLIAAKNAIDNWYQVRQPASENPNIERARVTG